ncbi:MAG: hypothetical protein QME94_17350, partial [Anaerolineae bacterium]|nr:hypothetical protein [Anaerolineae bacterium]
MIPRFVTQDHGPSEAGPGSRRSPVGDLLRRGQAAAQKGDLARARRLLRAALMADPSNVEARLWLAAIADDPEQSVQLLTQVLGEHPDHRRALAGLRWACERLQASRSGEAATPPPAGPQLELLPEPPRKRGSFLRFAVAVACLLAILTGAFAAASLSWARAEPLEAEPPLELAPISLESSQMIEL